MVSLKQIGETTTFNTLNNHVCNILLYASFRRKMRMKREKKRFSVICDTSGATGDSKLNFRSLGEEKARDEATK